MPVQQVTLGIETQANTAGATQAQAALAEVENQAEDTAREVNQVNGDGLARIPAGATQAQAALAEVGDQAEDTAREINQVNGDGVARIPAQATQAQAALAEVETQAEDTAREVNQVNGDGLARIPAQAKPAAGSLAALEAEVNDLNQQLQRLRVGSEEFTVMSQRVRATQTQLAAARAEAGRLAGTVGRRGNGGAAVLEFSRAFEDAQYGIRGVLNNLPGFIAMLGGSAGLAGVISVVAVAGNVLWETFTKKPDEAGKKLQDYLDIYKKLADEFGNSDLISEQGAKTGYEELLKDQERFETGQERIAKAEDDIIKKRTAADTSVAVATERLDLTRTEAALVNSTGERAVELATRREAIILRITELERQQTESQRALEIQTAQRKTEQEGRRADEAGFQKDRFKRFDDEAQTRVTDKNSEVSRALDAKYINIESLKALRDGFRKEQDPLNPGKFIALGSAIDQLNKEISNLETAPSQLEARAKIDLEQAQEVAKETRANFKEMSQAAKDAADKFKAAKLELETLKTTQDIQRDEDTGLKTVADTGAAEEKASRAVNEALAGLLESLGAAATSPPVTKLADQIKALAADGVDGGEQQEVFGLFQQLLAKSSAGTDKNRELLNKIIAVIDTSVSSLGAVTAKLDEQNRRIKTLETNLRR